MGCVGQWMPAVTMLWMNVAMGLLNVVAKKTLDGGLNHMVFATYRLAISAVFLAPMAYFWERKTRPKITMVILGQHFLSGLLGASLCQFFLLLGLLYTSPTLVCAFASMQPAFTFAMSLMLRQEKIRVRSKGGMAKMLGIFLCVGGAMFLTFYKGMPLTNHRSQSEALSNHPITQHHSWILGCLFLLLGILFLCSWIVFQAKINVTFPCQYSSTVLMSIFATFQCALLSLIQSRHLSDWIIVHKFDIFSVIYAGVVGQAFSTVATSWCIRKRGPIFTCTFTPLLLISATIFDVVFLHRTLYIGSIMGSIIIVTGLYVFLWGQNKEVADATLRTLTKETSQIEKMQKDNHHDEYPSNNDSTKLPV